MELRSWPARLVGTNLLHEQTAVYKVRSSGVSRLCPTSEHPISKECGDEYDRDLASSSAGSLGGCRGALLHRDDEYAGSCRRHDDCAVVDRPAVDPGPDHPLLLQLRKGNESPRIQFL